MPSRKTKATLQEIEDRIAALQAEADALKARDKSEVIAKAKVAIEHYGITAAELGLAGRGAAGRATKSVATPAKPRSGARKPVPVRYRDAEGNTWTGRGNKPRWLAAALAAGHKIEEFLVTR